MTFPRATPSKSYAKFSIVSKMTNRTFILFILLLSLLMNAGCFNANPDDQELPWSRPADWEGGVPGVGN